MRNIILLGALALTTIGCQKGAIEEINLQLADLQKVDGSQSARIAQLENELETANNALTSSLAQVEALTVENATLIGVNLTTITDIRSEYQLNDSINYELAIGNINRLESDVYDYIEDQLIGYEENMATLKAEMLATTDQARIDALQAQINDLQYQINTIELTPGAAGAAGSNGTNGTNGTVGANGIDGTNGTNGTNGIDGGNGASGNDGNNGDQGIQGIQGIQGETGLSASEEAALLAAFEATSSAGLRAELEAIAAARDAWLVITWVSGTGFVIDVFRDENTVVSYVQPRNFNFITYSVWLQSIADLEAALTSLGL